MAGLSERLTLLAGRLRAVLAPADGGRIAEFSLALEAGEVFPLLQPLCGDPAGPRRSGCYPLLPYSNRIARAQFDFAGETVRLAPHPLFAPEAIHGLGWRRPWRVRRAGEASAVLELAHAPDADWPWGFTARQMITLDAEGLQLVLEARSADARPQPMGLGYHPYFPLQDDSTLQLPATGAWEADARRLPVRHGPLPPGLDFRTPGSFPAETIDGLLTGWSGEAVLRWPGAGIHLRLSSAPGLAVLFRPAGEQVVAIEPVTHATNALNLPSGSGPGAAMPVLQPGETLSLAMRLAPQGASPKLAAR